MKRRLLPQRPIISSAKVAMQHGNAVPAGAALQPLHRPATDPADVQQLDRDCLVACVGDVHNLWDPAGADGAALAYLQPDMTVFVGDFASYADEALPIITQVAKLQKDFPGRVFVQLGNHETWRADEKMLRKQIGVLGPTFAGYNSLPIPDKSVAVVGARPFAQGSDEDDSFKTMAGPIIAKLFPDVTNHEASVTKVVNLVTEQAAAGRDVVIATHNAHAGLGSWTYSIAGKDFEKGGGDFGEPDLKDALDKLSEQGINVPLVLCGHMHHKLNWKACSVHGPGRERCMVHIDPTSHTVTLNAAVVPRIKAAPRPKKLQKVDVTPEGSPSLGQGGQRAKRLPTLHHFVLARLQCGRVVHAKGVWVRAEPVGNDDWSCSVEEEQGLVKVETDTKGAPTMWYWDGFHKKWRAAGDVDTVEHPPLGAPKHQAAGHVPAGQQAPAGQTLPGAPMGGVVPRALDGLMIDARQAGA